MKVYGALNDQDMIANRDGKAIIINFLIVLIL